MVVDKLWHDGDGDSAGALSKDFCNLLVLEANHVLSIDLSDAVLSEDAVTGGDGVSSHTHTHTHMHMHTHTHTHSPSCRGILYNLVDLIPTE